MITVAHVDEQSGLRGGEQQANWLIRGLARRGVANVLVGRPGKEFLSMDVGGAKPVRIALPLRGELDLYSAWRLARATRTLGIDIIHAHTSHAHGLARIALALGATAKVVVSRRVNFPPKAHRLNRWKYEGVDRILCVSNTVKDTMTAFGLDAQKVRTVHSAVDPERALMPPVDRSSLNIPGEVQLVFSAGSLVDHKDHKNLLEAFALARRELPGMHLCIAGDGPLRAGLEALRFTLGLDGWVTFLGYRADAPGITRSADLYVSSSWSEGLGTSILEALAAEVPVVAAEAGGAREMVIPGQTGYLVPPRNARLLADAMVRALRNPEESQQMARTGKNHALACFSVERMVEGTLETYRELLEESVGSRTP